MLRLQEVTPKRFFKAIQQYFLLLVCCCIAGNGFSQNIDSLKASLTKAKDDSVKVEIFLQIARQLGGNNDEALSNLLQAKQTAEKIGNAFLKENVYLNLAYYYDLKEEHNTTQLYFSKAVAAGKEIRDDAFVAYIYSEMGSTYRIRYLLDSSLFFNLKALELRKALPDKRDLASSYNNTARVYRMVNNYENALACYTKCMELYEELKDEENLFKVLMNLGQLCRTKKKYGEAFNCFTKANAIAAKFKDKGALFVTKLNSALCMNDAGQHNKAYEILAPLIKDTSFKINSEYPLLVLGFGVAAVGTEHYTEGIAAIEKALQLNYKNASIDFWGAAHQYLSIAYEKTGSYNLSLEHYKKYRFYDDSIHTESNSRNINELTTKYQTKEKEQAIILLSKDNELKDLSIKEKQRTSLLYALGLILVSLITIGVAYLYRNKRRVSRQLEEKNAIISVSLKEKEVLLKEIHHRVKNNLQVISSLLSLQSKSINDEAALQALNEGRNRVKSMALIHQNLYRDDNLMGVDVQEYIEKLIGSLFASYNIEPDKIVLKTDIDAIELDVDTVIPLGLILNELISNALKYAFEGRPKGLLEISLKKIEEGLLLRVRDDGKGIDNDDLNKSNSTSMGHKLVQSFLQKLQATMNIEKNNGTNIELTIKKFKLTQ